APPGGGLAQAARRCRCAGRAHQDGGRGLRERSPARARHVRESGASQGGRCHLHGRAHPSVGHAGGGPVALAAPRGAHRRDPGEPPENPESEGAQAPRRGRRLTLLARGAILSLFVLLLLSALPGSPAAAPEGTLTWGLHVTLAARWLDPSDTEAFIN